MLVSSFLFLCAFFVGLDAQSREIPSYIHICKRSDPHVAKCIRESVEFLRPRLQKGIPELGVPSIEPLHINEIQILRGGGEGRSNLRAVLRDVNVYGASNFEITKLKVNVDKYTYRVGVKFPTMQFKGVYDVDARILVVPVKGSGQFTADIKDVDGQGVLKGDLIEHNGHRELKFTSFDFAIKVRDFDLKMDNLFNGDPVLSRAVSDVLHENKNELIQAALPFVEKKAAEILLEAANKITDDLDYDKVFPEN